MPVGAQCVSRMPISWPWNTGRPWWPDWVIERDRRAVEVGAEVLERVEVRVRAEQAHVADAHELVEAALRASRPRRRSPRSRPRRSPRTWPCAAAPLRTCRLGAAGEDDREVDVAGDVEDRLVAPGGRARSRTRGAPGRTSRRAARAHASNLRVIAVFGLRRLLRRADHGDRLRVQERVEVDVAQAAAVGPRRRAGEWRRHSARHAGSGADGDREYDARVRFRASW